MKRTSRKHRNRKYTRKMRNETSSTARGLLFKSNSISREIAELDTKITAAESEKQRIEMLKARARASQVGESENRAKYHFIRERCLTI